MVMPLLMLVSWTLKPLKGPATVVVVLYKQVGTNGAVSM